MTDLWLCLNCDSITGLDRHGRCAVCGSDAVVRRTEQRAALMARLWPAQVWETLFGESD